MRRIPPGGINLFQLIYILIREYTDKTGLSPLNLSLGNPDGVPPEAIRKLEAAYAADPGYDYHTYAEDKNLLGFAEAMVEIHGQIRVSEYDHLRAVPIPGIKGATALLPLACGLHLPDRKRRDRFNVVSNLPAYDVIGTWSENYLGARRIVWPLASEDGMRLNVARLEDALRQTKLKRVDLIQVIRPGNPAAVGATAREWEALIQVCLKTGARLANDAAYVGLAEGNHVPLAAVAKNFPKLEWMEMYSVSKSFNDPGARLGALVGSKDFVEDFILVKGNTDSGPVPAMMAAYGKFFEDRTIARKYLTELRGLYQRRLDYVVPRLRRAGLVEACKTDAGFFTLWKVPRKVLGIDIAKDSRTKTLPLHEAFNRLVIAETGIVGVHFQGPIEKARGPKRGPAGGEPLIRYAVCTDVLDPRFQSRFEEALDRLKPEY